MTYSFDTQTKISLNIGVDIVRKDNQAIILNRINSKWLRLPLGLVNLVEECTKNTPETVIKEYTLNNEIPAENITNFMGYLINEDFIQTNYSIKKGIDIVNYSNTSLESINIKEINKFLVLTISLTKSNISSYVEILDRLRGSSIKHLRVHLDKSLSLSRIMGVVELANDIFDLIGYIVDGQELFKLDEFENPDISKNYININGDALLQEYCNDSNILTQLSEINIKQNLVNIKYLMCFTYEALAHKNFKEFYVDLSKFEIPVSISSCFPLLSEKEVINTEFCEVNYKNLITHIIDSKQSSYIDLDFRYYRKLKMSCGAGKDRIYISDNGNVYPCISLIDFRYVIGNVFQQDLEQIEERSSEVLASCNVDEQKQCSGCDIAYFCGSGCLSRRLLKSKTKQEEPFCSFIKSSIGQNPWLYSEDKDQNTNLKVMLDAITQ